MIPTSAGDSPGQAHRRVDGHGRAPRPTPDPHTTDGDWQWLDALPASEMLERVRAHDWGSSELGPAREWPPLLRTSVSMCLSSRFPMLVLWGPRLIKLYNDGYRDMLGSTKHPGALGSPAESVWSEIWHEIGPSFASVWTTGNPTWAEHQPLVIDRNGYLEETWFTYSFSAVTDEHGVTQGILDIATETTEYVLTERRLRALSLLGTSLTAAEEVVDVCLAAARTLSYVREDITAVDIVLFLGDEPVRVASNRLAGDLPPALEAHLPRLRAGDEVVIGGRGDALPAEHIIVPLIGADGDVDGVMIGSLDPLRRFDEEFHRFVTAIARTIATAIHHAHRRSESIGRYREISETLQHAMLQPASDLPTVAARYLPASGTLAVGGDWYDVIDLSHDQRALVVGDCVGHGLAAAAAMSQLRSALRALLLEGIGPAQALEGLDAFVPSVPDAFCTTVVVAVVDRQAGTVTYARAGHPPPLLVGRSGRRWLAESAGPPIGVAEPGARAATTVPLESDDTIVLYSDGLIERRSRSLDAGLVRLEEVVSELQGRNVQYIADAILRSMVVADSEDDVVLLVKHFPHRE